MLRKEQEGRVCTIMPKLNRSTWFLFADNAKARLYASRGFMKGWTLAEEWDSADARKPDRELGTAAPTRGHKIGSGGRYSVNETSEHDQAGEAFVTDVARFLNDAAVAGKFDQLVMSAPARALSTLRRCLRPEVTQKYIAVWDKDLTNMMETDLLAYCRARLDRW